MPIVKVKRCVRCNEDVEESRFEGDSSLCFDCMCEIFEITNDESQQDWI